MGLIEHWHQMSVWRPNPTPRLRRLVRWSLHLLPLAILLLIAWQARWFWSPEQRAVYRYLHTHLNDPRELEFIEWKPARDVLGKPGVSQAVWCAYRCRTLLDQLMRAESIFYIANGEVVREIHRRADEYAEALRVLYGPPVKPPPVKKAPPLKKVAQTVPQPVRRPREIEEEPNWSEPDAELRLRLLTRLIAHWQTANETGLLPATGTLKDYLHKLPVVELIKLAPGDGGKAFLSREALKDQWIKRGRRDPWTYPTFLKRDNLFMSPNDGKPFVVERIIIEDSEGRERLIGVHEATGTIHGREGDLPPVHTVWAADLAGNAFQLQLLGDPKEWKISRPPDPALVNRLAVPSSGVEGQVLTRTDPLTGRQLRYTAAPLVVSNLRAKQYRGIVTLSGKVTNPTEEEIRGAWVTITPIRNGGAMAQAVKTDQLNPVIIRPGGVAVFSTQFRMIGPNDRYQVDCWRGEVDP